MRSRFVKFGASQGRIIRPHNGELQCFPKGLWETEFHLAAALQLGHIELLAERQFNPENPLWSESGISSMKGAAEASGINFYSACNDFIIDHSLLESTSTQEQALNFLNPLRILGCSIYVLPLFEKSQITSENYEKFIPFLDRLSKAAIQCNIQISLETLLTPDALQLLCSKINRHGIGVCFDTGNRAANGARLGEEIRRLGPLINHVHLKDKNLVGENVVLGTGAVNFLEVLTELERFKYSGSFTFETNRGRNPFLTMAHNLRTLEFFLNEVGWSGF